MRPLCLLCLVAVPAYGNCCTWLLYGASLLGCIRPWLGPRGDDGVALSCDPPSFNLNRATQQPGAMHSRAGKNVLPSQRPIRIVDLPSLDLSPGKLM